MTSEEFPGWDGDRRLDGLTIAEREDGRWHILPAAEDQKEVSSCPCCGAFMRTRRTARLVANAFFPVAS